MDCAPMAAAAAVAVAEDEVEEAHARATQRRAIDAAGRTEKAMAAASVVVCRRVLVQWGGEAQKLCKGRPRVERVSEWLISMTGFSGRRWQR